MSQHDRLMQECVMFEERAGSKISHITKIAVASKARTLTINVKGTCAGPFLYGALFCFGEGRGNIMDKAKTMERCRIIPAFAQQHWVCCATFMHGYIII